MPNRKMSFATFKSKINKADESGLIDWKEIARKLPCSYTAMRNYINGDMPEKKYRILAPKIIKLMNAQIDRKLKTIAKLKIENYA